MMQAIENANKILIKIGKIREKLLKETDKDKIIELFGMMFLESTEYMKLQKEVMNDCSDKLKEANELINILAKLSVNDPKECRRKLKAIYKSNNE
ncbi:hypothetical protein [Clostridium saccharoperbutylacetonicum]